MALPPSKGACSTCGEQAGKKCSGCKEGLDEYGVVSATFYCNEECQRADFSKHRAVCKLSNARKQLYRGGDLLHRIFLGFREVAFDTDLVAITVENGMLWTHEGKWDWGSAPLFPFPKQLVSNEEDKMAVLTHLACGDASAYMGELVKKVLVGICGKKPITEDSYHVKKEHLRIARTRDKGLFGLPMYIHEVMVIPLVDGKDYVLDLAGAQFGQYQPVVSFNIYHKEFVRRVLKSRKFGENFRYLKYRADKDILPGDTADYRVQKWQIAIAQHMNKFVETWECLNRIKVSDVLTQKQHLFEADRNALVAYVREEMNSYVDYLMSCDRRLAEEAEAGKVEAGKAESKEAECEEAEDKTAKFQETKDQDKPTNTSLSGQELLDEAKSHKLPSNTNAADESETKAKERRLSDGLVDGPLLHAMEQMSVKPWEQYKPFTPETIPQDVLDFLGEQEKKGNVIHMSDF